MSTDLDLLVLGGGCAGLSLALRLAEQSGQCRRVGVIEARASYSHDRSWCFWRTGPHRHEALVRRSWPKAQVVSASMRVQLACTDTPYQLLESGAFYDHAARTIAASGSVRLHTGVSVSGPPRQIPDGWRVETSAGSLTARQVVDTRPTGKPQVGGSALWQSFLGQEVICDQALFDPDRVELMNFAPDAQGVVAFTYVLPLAVDHALIETTMFDPLPHGPSDLAARQNRAVKRLCGDATTAVVRTESGILPMGMVDSASPLGAGHSRAGLMSGAARPATGYAFQRIQRWADAGSESLRRGEPLRGHAPDPLLTRFMDKLFLDVLRDHPQRAPELFTRLFDRTPTPRAVRFLSDQASFLDRLAVAASLPTGLFLRQLMLPASRRPARIEPVP